MNLRMKLNLNLSLRPVILLFVGAIAFGEVCAAVPAELDIAALQGTWKLSIRIGRDVLKSRYPRLQLLHCYT